MARHRGYEQSFLARLRGNTGGNVMAMTAAALIPLIAMIGGAIDASRIYMSYTRLQQACDAGALAGRKAMSNVTVLSDTERSKALEFFDFNFPDGTYSAVDRTRSYAKGADGVVIGNAAISMPTTIMKIFGYEAVPLSVTCQSTLNIPNTDVMFVLDVTGSMDDTVGSDTKSKLEGLKDAVKDFYKELGPGSASGPGRVRYGFMPYSSNVNVGRILYAANPSFMAGGSGTEQYGYQSRVAETTTEHYIASYGNESGQSYGNDRAGSTNWDDAWQNVSGSGNYKGYTKTFTDISSGSCDSKNEPPVETGNPTYQSPTYVSSSTPNYPDATQTLNYTSSGSAEKTQYRYKFTKTNSQNGKGTCQLQSLTGETSYSRSSTTTRPVNWADRERFVRWNYQKKSYDVSAFVQSTDAASNPAYWRGYYTGGDPNDGAPSSFSWGGCIEEASTVNTINASSSITPPDAANDLKIDLVPNSTDTRWKPFLRQVQYDRSGNWLGRDAGWIANGFGACPREASKLTQYVTDYNATSKSSTNFNTYVNSLTAIGGTYHDVGMIWGARFLSQDGIFGAENSDVNSPGGYQVSRHIVFMTDGTLDTKPQANDMWGINNLDGRIGATSASETDLEAAHKRRTEIICNGMKSKGFTIWVIGFGLTAAQMPQTLKDCASDSAHWSAANNTATLRARFAAIAQTIGGLRLSQ